MQNTSAANKTENTTTGKMSPGIFGTTRCQRRTSSKSGSIMDWEIISEQIPAVGAYYVYKHVDYSPLNGINYYRLLLVEENGEKSHTHSVAVDVSMTSFELMNVRPVPTIQDVQITFSAVSEEQLLVKVINVLGEELMQKQVVSVAGINKVSMNLGELESGDVARKFF